MNMDAHRILLLQIVVNLFVKVVIVVIGISIIIMV